MDNNNLDDFPQTLKQLEEDIIFLASLVEQMSCIISNMSITCVRRGGRVYIPPLKS